MMSNRESREYRASRWRTACASVLLLGVLSQYSSTVRAGNWQDCTCGGEGESICFPWNDPVCYFNNAVLPALYEVFTNDGCDRGLSPDTPYFCDCLFYVPVPDTCGCALRVWGKCIIPKLCWKWVCVPKLCIDCGESSREQGPASTFRGTWTHRKMKEQRVLANDEPINWVTRIAGHNAYNNAADHYRIPNQTYSITDQLNAGARVIMLDIHGDPGTNGIALDGNLRLAHGGADCVGCNPLDRPAVYGFKEIGRWVAEHPDEIVLVELEDYDVDGTNIDDLIGPIQKYLGPWVLTKLEKPLDRWPTRGEMLASGRRVVVSGTSFLQPPILFDGRWGGPYRHSLSGAKANEFDTATCDRFRAFDKNGTINTQVFSEVWEDRSFIGTLEPAGVICSTGSTLCEDPPLLDAALNALLDLLGISLRLDPLCCNDPSQSTPMRQLIECNTAIIGLDRLLDAENASEPQRLREVVWSWQYGYNAPNGHAAKLASGLDRWQSATQDEIHPFACAKFRENDPTQWEDPAGREWRITEAVGPWEDGFLACIFEYGAEGFTFSVPVSGFQQRQLAAMRNDLGIGDDIWLAYRDTTGAGNWQRDDGYDPDIWSSQRVAREGEWVQLIPKASKLQNCDAPREFIWNFGEGDLINNGSDPSIFYYYRDERRLIESVDFPVTVTEHYPGGECGNQTLDAFLFVFNKAPEVSLVQDPIFVQVETDAASISGTTFDSGVIDAQAVAIEWSPQTPAGYLIPARSTNIPLVFDENADLPGTTGEFDASHVFGNTECGVFGVNVTAVDNDGGRRGASVPIEVLDVTPVVEFPPSIYLLFEQNPLLEEGLMSIDLGEPAIIDDTICYPIQFVNDAPTDGFPPGLTIVTWTARLSPDGSDCSDGESFCEIVAFGSQTVYATECLIAGDVDLNCLVDRCDLGAINDRIGEDADGPSDPADVNGDGVITIADVRFIENNSLCDQPDCGDCGCNRWVRAGDSPDHLFNSAMVHDVHRGETVLFGGYISDGVTTLEQADTWLLDANGWSRTSSASSGGISGRNNHAMAYDLARGVTVTATGGPTLGTGDNTWEWNGGRWTLRSDDTTDVHPSTRTGSAMAYDTKLRQVVLFGGGGTQAQASETWVWRNFAWTQRWPLLSPPARSDHAMAYDSTLQTVILFGGTIGFGQEFCDTWEWDGNQWALLADTGPSPRANAAMAYDPIRGAMILHGGSSSAGGNDPGASETWAWDGRTWALVSATGPTAPGGHTLTYDSTRRGVVLFVPTRVAVANGPGFNVGETWVFEADGWVQIASTPPFDRSETAMVYDSTRGQSILFGGSVTHPSFDPADNDTWVYAEGLWVASPGNTNPNESWRHAMAYDEARDQVVLFGGANCCTTFDDTWVWDPPSRTWSQMQGLNPIPDRRSRHAMAYDSRRQVVVMFGGEDDGMGVCCPNPGPQTWEWDGSSWRMTHDGGPSRSRHAMVYDPIDDVVLLYGGTPSSDETWAYSVDEVGNATWTRRFPVYPFGVAPPPGLTGHRMIYDTERGTVSMFGGRSFPTFSLNANSWVWDRAGGYWKPLDTTSDPPARENFAMSYDRKRQASVIFAGSGGLRDTWELTSGFPRFIETPSDQVVSKFGQRLELTATLGGLGPFTYQWFKDGDLVKEGGCSGASGVRTATLTINPVNASDAGQYYVAVGNGCNIDTPIMSTSIDVAVSAALLDCNRNGRDDSTDIICGGDYVCSNIAGSFDCDQDGIPDECGEEIVDLERLETFDTGGSANFSLNGSATIDAGAVRLTEAIASQNGTVIFEPVTTAPLANFTASFDFRMGIGTSRGADGISFALLNAKRYGPDALFGEAGPGPGSLVIRFDTYDNNGVDPSDNFVQIINNGIPIANTDPPFMLDNFQWHHAEIIFENDRLTMTLMPSGGATVTIFDSVPIPGFTPFISRYGLGGRTGGLTNEHRIDNVRFSTRTSAVACDQASVLPCEGTPGDINADGVVDINDHAAFVVCMSGPNASPTPGKPLTVERCLAIFDSNDDGDVDFLDAAKFSLLFGTP